MAVSQSVSLTQGTQSVANNTTQVTFKWTSTQTGESWNGYTKTAYYYVSINGGAETKYSVSYTLPKASTATIASKTFTVTHNNNGTGKISVRTWMDTGISAGVVEKTTSLTLTTIPRASSFGTITGTTIGSDMTVNISRKDSSFTHQLWYRMGSSSWYNLGSGIGTSKTFTISNDLLSQLPNSTQGTLQLCVRTLKGTTRIGSDVFKDVTVSVNANVVPSLGTVTIDPVNITTTDGTDRNILVKDKNKITVSVSGCKAGTGSSIKNYKFIALSGSTTIASTTTTSTSATLGPFSKTGELKFRVVVTDTRGRSASNSGSELTQECYDYFSPELKKFNAYRANSDGTPNMNGTYLKCDYTTRYASVNSTNTISVTAYYNSNSVPGSNDGVLINLNGDTATTYNVHMQISDNYGGYSSTSSATVFGSSRIMNITPDGTGIALGKMAESSELLECRWPAKFNDTLNATGNISTNGDFGSSASYDSDHFAMYCQWADLQNHDMIVRTNDGLTMGLGWIGNSSYPTVLDVRPQTVNVRGTMNVPRGRFTSMEDASCTEQNDVPLRVGNASTQHIDIDANEIIAKRNPTTTGELYLSGSSVGLYIDEEEMFYTGTDDRGRYIRSLPAYTRTYEFSPNVFVTSTGTFGRTTSSSKRYKTDICDVQDESLNPYNLLNVPVRQFKYNQDNVPVNKNIDDIYIGFIAEEVAREYPAAAEYNEDGQVEMWNMKVMIPAMLKIVQDQQKEIAELKLEINKLKSASQN